MSLLSVVAIGQPAGRVRSKISLFVVAQEAAMALFVVRHQHAAETCPAQDPYMGAMLLNYLSRPNVKQHGVKIQGEAVVQGEHTFYLIVEAADEEHSEPSCSRSRWPALDIYPASTCARVVASGGCGAPLPSSGGVPRLNPEEACQQAIEAGLVVHRAHPLNCETSIPALPGGVVMPSARFYVRNHFQIPTLDTDTFRLTVGGAGRSAAEPDAARSPQHAVADPCRHAGVRGQRPHAVRAAD